MRGPGGRLILLLLLLGATVGLPADRARASAWSQPKGEGQVIVKLEATKADRALDHHGQTYDLLDGRRDGVASVLIEYGLTDRLTLQAKGDWQSGRDGMQRFEGRGPVEIGARWRVYQDDRNVVAVYAGYAQSGETRNAGYAEPGQGERDIEYRLLAGRGTERMFAEIQLARRLRQGLPDEGRMDLTLGYHVTPEWTLMSQLYMGRTDANLDGDRSQWVVNDFSVIRHFGDWSGQVAWRQTLAGSSTPVSRGPVLAVWRRF